MRLNRNLLRSFGMTIAFLWGLFLTTQLAIATDLPAAQAHTPPPQLVQAIDQLAAKPGQVKPEQVKLEQVKPEQSAPSDYFDQIQKVKVGYLLWKEFPVRVAIDPTGPPRWQTAVRAGVEAWQPYFPIEIVNPTDRRTAQIRIQAERFKLVRSPGSKELPRFRAAETRYNILPILPDVPTQVLRHEMLIALPPGQADGVMQSAARHEMGHALGLWGHSMDANDVMYFAQVKSPPSISPRDLRTLKRIYEQPTRLGETLHSEN
jgi:predicted Zn-dependent protease